MKLTKISRHLFLASLLAMFLAAPALAGFEGPGAQAGGGFQGPGTDVPNATVQQVKNMADDSVVSMTGNITSKVTGTKDKYIFRDASGEMTVEIGHKRFGGQTVTPANTVRLVGKVDKDFGRAVEVDVKQIEIVK